MAKLMFLQHSTNQCSISEAKGLLLTSINSKWRPIWRPKPEVHISEHLDMILSKFERLPMFSGSRSSNEILQILPDITGSRKSKMADVKPVVSLKFRLPVTSVISTISWTSKTCRYSLELCSYMCSAQFVKYYIGGRHSSGI